MRIAPSLPGGEITGGLLPMVTIVIGDGRPFPSPHFELVIVGHPGLRHVHMKTSPPGT
ncbi:MAG: hypothetical protein Q4B08_02730 [Propionibacteriaceae bacterium]|nr:hypothetical protein [Propionibacteriaceae bacterium]